MEDSYSRFQEEDISKILSLGNDEISQIEKNIAAEFKSLSKAYLIARLSRIDHMISSIDDQINSLKIQEKDWQGFFDVESKAVDDLKYNAENLILSGNTSKKSILRNQSEFENEIQIVQKNLRSPLDFEGIIEESGSVKNKTIPFEANFDQMKASYQQELARILKEKDHIRKLLDTNLQANRSIAWTQYYQNMIKNKENLIRKSYDELHELHKEYFSLRDNVVSNSYRKHYYRTLVKSSQLKELSGDGLNPNSFQYNHDSDNISDNRYVKKNKIELTDIRNGILNKVKSLGLYTEPLRQCEGMSEPEIEHDLALLRNLNSKMLSEQEIKYTETEEQKDSQDDVVSMEDDFEDIGNHNNEAESVDLRPDRDAMEKNYRRILKLRKNAISLNDELHPMDSSDQASGSLKFLQLPPFEVFANYEQKPVTLQ